jgi:hypothetical protein
MSDQTRPLANLAIHFGSHRARCPSQCNDWLVEWPPHSALPHQEAVDKRGDLTFRTRIAMLGAFGVSAPTDTWQADDYTLVRDHIELYKNTIRPLVHTGEQYLLTAAPPPDGDGDWAAAWYVSKDATQGVLFAFRLASTSDQRSFALPGLVPDEDYAVTTPEGWRAHRLGAELATGIDVTIDDPFRSALVVVRRTPQPPR